MNNKTATKYVSLNRIGSVNTQINVMCQNLTIDYVNGEYITAMELNYNLKKNISFVSFTTNSGRDIEVGKRTTPSNSSVFNFTSDAQLLAFEGT